MLKVLSYSGNSQEAAHHAALYQAIDEYFRKRFRKFETQTAIDILLPLGEDTTKKLTVLDDKFWVWETLEEATKPAIDDMKEEDLVKIMKAYAANYKGG